MYRRLHGESFRFDAEQGTVDRSPFQSRGTLAGNAAIANNRLRLDGTGDYMQWPSETNLTFGDGSTDRAFSIGMFCTRRSGGHAAIGKYDSGQSEFRLLFFNNNNTLYFNTFDDSANAYVGRTGVITVPANNEFMIAGSYDGSAVVGGFRSYFNGERVDTTNFSGNTYTAMEDLGAPLKIGQAATLYSTGTVRLAWIVDHVVSDREMMQIYRDKLRQRRMRRTAYSVPAAAGFVSAWAARVTSLAGVPSGA